MSHHAPWGNVLISADLSCRVNFRGKKQPLKAIHANNAVVKKKKEEDLDEDEDFFAYVIRQNIQILDSILTYFGPDFFTHFQRFDL